MDLGAQASGIGALADDTRRALYEYVAGEPEPVGREQAARALGIAVHNASFHLDKLAAEGLLDVEFRRLSGRRGPGAGRPSKLYRRADREFAISLPPRRYDLVGDILASAVERVRDGQSLDDALQDAARSAGLALAGEVAHPPGRPSLADLARLLSEQGFEAKLVDDEVVELANCPFDVLAHKYTDLVCGLNQAYVQGIVDGVGCDRVRACLEPEPGRCCVKARVQD